MPFRTLIDEMHDEDEAPARAKAKADQDAAEAKAKADKDAADDAKARAIAREEAKKVIDEEIEPAPAKDEKGGGKK